MLCPFCADNGKTVELITGPRRVESRSDDTQFHDGIYAECESCGYGWHAPTPEALQCMYLRLWQPTPHFMIAAGPLRQPDPKAREGHCSCGHLMAPVRHLTDTGKGIWRQICPCGQEATQWGIRIPVHPKSKDAA